MIFLKGFKSEIKKTIFGEGGGVKLVNFFYRESK